MTFSIADSVSAGSIFSNLGRSADPSIQALAGEIARLATQDPAQAVPMVRDATAEIATAIAEALDTPSLEGFTQTSAGREVLDALHDRVFDGTQLDRIRNIMYGVSNAPSDRSPLQKLQDALPRALNAEPFIQKTAGGGAASGGDVKGLFKEQFAKAAASKEGFDSFMKEVFGDKYDKNLAEQYRQRALSGDFSWLPEVKYVDAATLGGANGAYNAEEGVVYINRDLAASDPAKATQTFVEEAGHHLDSKLNTTDTKGDEGEMFRRMLGGEQLTQTQIAEIRNENDKGTITVDGKQVEVEFWNPFKAVGDAAKAVGGAIADGAKAVGGAIADGAKAVGRAAEQIGGGIFDGAKKIGEGILGAGKNFLRGVFDMSAGFLMNIFQGNIGEAFSSVVRGVDRAIFQTANRLWVGALEGVQSVANGITDALGPIGKPIRWVTDRVFDIGRTAIDTGFALARSAFRMIPDAAIGFVTDVERAVKLAADGRWGDAAEQFGMAFVNVPKRIVGTAVDMGAQFLQGVASAGQTAVGAEPPARGLKDEERAYLESIYGDSIDYDMIRVKQGGPLNDKMAAHTVGNTVYMPSKYFDANGKLTKDGLETLGHEVGHVWQNQNGGPDYISDALGAQAWASVTGGSRNEAYDWRDALKNGESWESMNAEEQAKVMEDLGIALKDGWIKAEDGIRGAGTVDTSDDAPAYTPEELKFLQETAQKVKFGQGAG